MEVTNLNVITSSVPQATNVNAIGSGKSNTLSTNNNFNSMLNASITNNTSSNTNSVTNNTSSSTNTNTSTSDLNANATNDDSTSDKLKEIENEISDIETGKDTPDDNKIAALLLSLQQILNAIVNSNNNNAANMESSNGAGNASTSSIQAQLSDIEKMLGNIINSLNSNENKGTSEPLKSTNTNDFLAQISKALNSIEAEAQTTGDATKNANSAQANNLQNELEDLKNCLALTNKLLDVSNSSGKLTDDSMLSKLKSEINSVLNELNKNNVDSNETVLEPAMPSTNTNLSADSNSNDSTSTSDKENDFLNSLVSNSKDSNDDNYSKVTNMINQFMNNTNTISNKTVATEQVMPQVRSTNFAEDIINNVKYMENNNIKDMTVSITPKDLGQVIINVTSENGVLKASITASNKEAYNLLNSNLGDINKNLNNQSVKFNNVEVSVYNGDTTFFKNNEQSESNEGQKNKKWKTPAVNGIDALDSSETNNLESIYDENNVNALA